MKAILKVLNYCFFEVLIVFSFILLINNFIGKNSTTINADGIGYYDYLPSLFIHHDLNRNDQPESEFTKFYERIDSTGVYVEYNGFRVNKYPCGTALMQLPFFTYSYLTTERTGEINDGYQKPYQKTVFHAAIFYLFVTLIYLKLLLSLYGIQRSVIVFCQLILVLGTSVTQYANVDAGFSHIYSLCAITAFMYYFKSFVKTKKTTHFGISAALLGLIFILRQPNILILLFVPFLAGSFQELKSVLVTILASVRKIALGLLLFLGVTSIQLIIWYVQTGEFLVYSYQGEGFDFSNPHFFEILFSYRKGLFVYAPILLIAMSSILWLALKKNYYLTGSWLVFFITITYIFSSWWSWFYGCSYGQRVYIDYYSIFLIPFAVMLSGVSTFLRILVMTVSLATIPLNIIQTYQYKEYILHWIDMDKEKYWKVFLETDDHFRGLVWKTEIDASQYKSTFEIIVGDTTLGKDSNTRVYTIQSIDIPNFDEVSIIQVTLDNDFKREDDTGITIGVDSKNERFYWHERSLIQFQRNGLNQWHTGLFNYEFEPMKDSVDKTISLEVKTRDRSVNLKNVKLNFLRRNN